MAEEILLARGPVEGLSARNVIAGEVDRVLAHGPEAEVLVRTGALDLGRQRGRPGGERAGAGAGVGVHMIIKARSCRVQGGIKSGNSSADDADKNADNNLI